MRTAVRQGAVVVILILQAVRVELLVAVGPSAQGVKGGAGAAPGHGCGAGGTVLTEAFFLKACHDLDISQVLQFISHRDGVIRCTQLAVHG